MPTLAGGRGLHLERTVTVLRPAEDVYRAWRDLERLPRLLRLVSVTPSGPRRTCWVGLPGGSAGEYHGRMHANRMEGPWESPPWWRANVILTR